MNKYINHRELLEILKLAKEEVLQKGIRTEDKLLMLYGLNYAIIAIENTLPADVQPVRHGRWIDRTEAYNDVPKYSCSQCGFVHVGLRTRFCPECGANMCKEEDDG